MLELQIFNVLLQLFGVLLLLFFHVLQSIILLFKVVGGCLLDFFSNRFEILLNLGIKLPIFLLGKQVRTHLYIIVGHSKFQ